MVVAAAMNSLQRTVLLVASQASNALSYALFSVKGYVAIDSASSVLYQIMLVIIIVIMRVLIIMITMIYIYAPITNRVHADVIYSTAYIPVRRLETLENALQGSF